MNYDFNNLNRKYTSNNKDIFSSEFGELDDIENDDSLYNELVPSDTYNLEDTIRLEKSVIDQFKNNDTVSIFDDDKLDKTLEIDTFELEYELAELLEPEVKKESKKKKRKWWHFPITVADDHHLEHAFVNCAVLGFITAAMGSGMLLYIMNHINPL